MRRAAALAVPLLACALLSPVSARALEGPRAEYRDQVEPICERNEAANEHILRGVRSKVRRGQVKPAGRQLTRAAAALRDALSELRKVARPSADEQRLSEWLAQISDQADLLQRAGKALTADERRRAGKLVTQLSTGARKANALVVGFEFHHCRLDPSRYT
jgi:hypothetical protein